MYRISTLLVLLLAAGIADAQDSHNEKAVIDSPFTPAVFKVVEATQQSLDEAFGPVESQMADELSKASKQILAHPVVFKALVANAQARQAADHEDEEESQEVSHGKYAKLAMAGLQTALRQSPGVMTRQELANRAVLISQVARYYGKHDPSMCRYLPQDFSILLNVDAPWVSEVEESVLEQAIADEKDALVRYYNGVMPIIIVDADVQTIFSKFAAEWLAGLDSKTKSEIASARSLGDYCTLWSQLLKDGARMSSSFPQAAHKVLLPLMTMPTRGWLDVGRWGFIQNQVRTNN